MKKTLSILGLGCAFFAATGCNKLKSRDELNQGVAAYKNAKYTLAVEHFKTSVDLDPTNMNGRLYLATAYMSQYIPGADTPDNNQMAKQAQDEFRRVLEKVPNSTIALASLASLAYQQAQGVPDLEQKFKRLDEAKDWYKKLVAADPQNKEAYYSLGVIDWAETYPIRTQARVKLGMKPEDPGPIKDKKDVKVKDDLRARNLPMVEDGIKNLQKAIEIDPNYDDAMAYLNLIYRERADLAETPEDYKKDSDTADTWVQKSLDTKKMKAQKQPQTGITQEAPK
jgi:tetratricopeptide (TPR) repeat protein